MLPVSVIIPTRNRSSLIGQTLDALLSQTGPPVEILVVDSSSDGEASLTQSAVEARLAVARGTIIAYHKALAIGAASQRNQGVALATQEAIMFLDDDIRMRPDCLEKMHAGLVSEGRIGGVSALIENNAYHPPGPVSRVLFAFLNGRFEQDYAGRCIGPGLTTPPSDAASLPLLVPVEWLITGCVLYRRAALPSPPFPPMFVGPSIAEDLALSLMVGKNWRLLNARAAQAAHFSATHRHSPTVAAAFAEMEVVNRHYIATQIIGRRSWLDSLRFLAMIFLFLPATLRQEDGIRLFPARLLGRLRGLAHVFGPS